MHLRYVQFRPKILSLGFSFFFVLFSACSSPTNSGTDDSDSTKVKGTKSAYITLTSEGIQTEAADISDENSAYQFGSKAIDTSSSTTFTLTNTGDVAATAIKAHFLTLPFSYTGGSYPGTGSDCGKTLAPGASCTVSLSFTPFEMATSQAVFKLSYNNGKNTRTFEKQLTGRGYSVPGISQISPSYSALAGGGTLTIVGTQIYSAAVVTIDGTLCIGTVTPPTTYSCTLPAHAAGSVDIKLTNSDGKSTTLSAGLNYYAAPVVTSISPSSGYTAGGQTLTITGTGFRSGAAVTVKNESCGTLTVDSTTQITCITSASGSGTGDVIVTNDDGQTSTLSNAFTFVGSGASWAAMSTIGAPTTRSGHGTVWTGAKLLVWGGYSPTRLNSGALYDPVTDSWQATSTVGATAPSAPDQSYWTGKKHSFGAYILIQD